MDAVLVFGMFFLIIYCCWQPVIFQFKPVGWLGFLIFSQRWIFPSLTGGAFVFMFVICVGLTNLTNANATFDLIPEDPAYVGLVYTARLHVVSSQLCQRYPQASANQHRYCCMFMERDSTKAATCFMFRLFSV